MKKSFFVNLFFLILFFQSSTAFSTQCSGLLSSKRSINIINDFNITPVEVNGTLNQDPKIRVDLSSFYKGKWLILDISASWCPYCKLDQFFFSALTNEPAKDYTGRENLWPKTGREVVQAHLFVEFQKEGAYQQNFEVIQEFLSPASLLKDDVLKGLNRSGIDSFFVNIKNPQSFTKALDENGLPILPNFTGFPHQLVINPDGEIIFNGSFTSSKPEDEGNWFLAYRRHYEMIEKKIAEFQTQTNN